MTDRSLKYAVPLVVRYDSLIALIIKNIESAVEGPTPGSALNGVLFKLRQWARDLSYENSIEATSGRDVLETLEASEAESIHKIHDTLSTIANQLQAYKLALKEPSSV